MFISLLSVQGITTKQLTIISEAHWGKLEKGRDVALLYPGEIEIVVSCTYPFIIGEEMQKV